MELDWQICSRARLARDPRFDGKFFIAVLSTGIYCRPICRSRTSKETNVRYFSTAAAAAEAGFRPCLRCRPEASPGTAGWLGTRNTVSRALRLIEESGLEDGGVEGLAQKLGIGSRHLRRLFLRHLGATPSSVARTRRLHFAKTLIDETRLPMTQIAIAAGFGCVRRFNAAIRKTYQRTPIEIRKLAKAPEFEGRNQYLFRLSYRPPYNWKALLAYLGAHATPGVEFVDGNRYCRSICLNGVPGYIEVGLESDRDELRLQLQCGDPRYLFAIVERVRAMFDLNADCSVIAAVLGRDPLLRPLLERNPGLRVPGCWDGFELTVRTLLGEQVTIQAASKIAGSLAEKLGRPVKFGNSLNYLFPSAEALADSDLVAFGLPKAKAQIILELARAVCDHHLHFDRLSEAQLLLNRLRAIRGIGGWTTQYIAMRALREPDAFPSDDLGLKQGLGIEDAAEVERRSEPWRPWRAYAAMYLWNISDRCQSAAVPQSIMERAWMEEHASETSSSVH